MRLIRLFVVKFPDTVTVQSIVDVCFLGLKTELLTEAMKTFYNVRNLPGLKKNPYTSEFLDWLKLLLAEDIPLEALEPGRQGGGAAAGGRTAEKRAGCASV